MMMGGRMVETTEVNDNTHVGSSGLVVKATPGIQIILVVVVCTRNFGGWNSHERYRPDEPVQQYVVRSCKNVYINFSHAPCADITAG